MEKSLKSQVKIPTANYYTAVLQALASNPDKALSVGEIAIEIKKKHPLPCTDLRTIRAALAQIIQVPLCSVHSERRGPFSIPVKLYKFLPPKS